MDCCCLDVSQRVERWSRMSELEATVSVAMSERGSDDAILKWIK